MGLGAGVGGWAGGVSVGAGAGTAAVPPVVGWEVGVLPTVAATGPDAPGDAACWPELGDAPDATFKPVLADGPGRGAVWPADDGDRAEVVAT